MQTAEKSLTIDRSRLIFSNGNNVFQKHNDQIMMPQDPTSYLDHDEKAQIVIRWKKYPSHALHTNKSFTNLQYKFFRIAKARLVCVSVNSEQSIYKQDVWSAETIFDSVQLSL